MDLKCKGGMNLEVSTLFVFACVSLFVSVYILLLVLATEECLAWNLRPRSHSSYQIKSLLN